MLKRGPQCSNSEHSLVSIGYMQVSIELLYCAQQETAF